MKYINKTSIIAWFAFMGILMLAACTKKSDPTPVTVTAANTFILRGVTYAVHSTDVGPVASGGSLTNTNYEVEIYGKSSAAASGSVGFIFNGASRPVAGSYAIVPVDITSTSAGVSANQVGILAIDSVNIKTEGLFTAVAANPVSAVVTINSAGKITITVPSTPLTGSNLDNTDIHNTVITTVNTTITGSFTEQ